jgi:tetratricopeptide (TPR) repeat protein
MSQMIDAENMASEALDIREKAVQSGFLDQYHPNRANGFMNLGVVVANRDAQHAIELHQKALDIRCGSSRYTNQQIHGLSLNYLNIGRCFWMVGNLAKAEQSFQNCLDIIKRREEICGYRFIV